MDDRSNWLTWLESINNDSELTAWEEAFIEDLNQKVEFEGPADFELTPREAEILQNIYIHKTP